MSKARSILSNMRKDIENLQNNIVSGLTRSIENGARKNFNKFIPYASTDYPFVDVTSTFSGGKTIAHGEVRCSGTQVLFIEFGVGAMNRVMATADYDVTTYTLQENGTYSFSHRSVSGRLGWKFVGSFSGGVWLENAPRPAGIVDLGQYGKQHGKDNYWIRPSIDGIPRSKGEMPVAIHGDPTRSRTDVVWTTGHRPARALYRAMRSSMKAFEKTINGGK